MLKFSPKIKLGMLIKVMLINKKKNMKMNKTLNVHLTPYSY